ncbi:MAG TPA: tRNA 5'-guanylyltransferase [Methanocorpusculum sp.]|nr:tRNA 5'-guanylyltransferase [Methanocorpusculum sp.]
MKNREIFSGLTTTLPFILRLDGRSFHAFSKEFAKPYDETFSGFFVTAARALIEDSGLSPRFAYTFSDEISLYFDTEVFDNRVEKLNSVAAGFVSSAFTIASGSKSPVSFDSRVIPITKELAPDYFAWRQAEAWRNHINGYAQKLLCDSGFSASAAQKKLDGLNASALHELAFAHGINLAETPAWQRRGICLYHTQIEREGYNPITDEKVTVLRRTIKTDYDIPLFKEPAGRAWLLEKL